MKTIKINHVIIMVAFLLGIIFYINIIIPIPNIINIVYLLLIVLIFFLLLKIFNDYAIGLLVMTLIIPLEKLFILTDKFTLNKLLGIIIFIVYYLKYRKIDIKVFNKELVIFYGFAIISFLWSIDIASSLMKAITIINYMLYLYLMITLKNRENILNKIIAAYVIGCILLALLGLVNFINTGYSQRVSGVDELDENWYGLIIGLSIILMYPIYNKTKSKAKKTLYLLINMILIIGLLVSLSRTAIIATIAAYIPFILTIKQKNYIKLINIGMIVLIVVLIFIYIPSIENLIMDRIQKSYDDQAGGRLNILTVGTEIYKDYPIFGVGLSNFPKAFTGYYIAKVQGVWLPPGRDPHNIYLAILVELGMIGAILFIIMIIKLFYGILKIQNRNDMVITLSLLTFILIAGMANTILYKKYFWLALSIIYLLQAKYE